MTELSHLFSPLAIGNITVRNRILTSAHIKIWQRRFKETPLRIP